MATGMSRSYLTTVVGILEDKELVAWVSTHPKGSRVRMRAYYLLTPGIQRVKKQRQAGKHRGIHRERHRASGEHRQGREHRQDGHGSGAGSRIRQGVRGRPVRDKGGDLACVRGNQPSLEGGDVNGAVQDRRDRHH